MGVMNIVSILLETLSRVLEFMADRVIEDYRGVMKQTGNYSG